MKYLELKRRGYDVYVGHVTPRCIVPFGISATVDVNNQIVCFGQN